MTEFLNTFFGSLKSYYGDASNGYLSEWWLPLLTAAIIYVLSLICIRFYKKRSPILRNYRILGGVIIASFIAAFGLIAVFCYLWSATSHYAVNKTQFLHLNSLALCLAIPIIAMVALRRLFDRDNLKSITNTPFTKHERDSFNGKAKDSFYRLKLWALLPAFGFLALFGLNYRASNLVSFLLDNSSSMEAHIENGKEALSETIMELHQNNDIVLGWFTDNNPKSSIEEIVAERDPGKLEGQHFYFQDRQQAVAHLFNIPGTDGTPLFESIWSNFLFSRQQAANRDYQRNLLIIVTDGGDNTHAAANGLSNFLCAQPEFDEFFSKVSCINLGGDLDNAFFSMAQECGYYIEEDGTTKRSYSEALNFILSEFRSDWFFIIWLAVIYGLGTIIVLMITPKRD